MAVTQTSYGKPQTQTTSSVAPTNATVGAPAVTAAAPTAAGAQTPYASTAKPMSAALPAVSGAAAPAAPPKFTGMDPTKSITGVQALQQLEQAFGQPLTADQRTQAMQYINYTDGTGAAAVSGADWNRLAQYAAGLSGGQFADWAPMPEQPGAVQPYPQEGPVYPETFQQPTVEAAPSYTAPTYTEERFTAPTQQEVYDDPGVRFREEQGRGALLASATARGMLGTGTTQRDLINYGQDLASQEYQAAYNRRADTFDRNTGERRFGYGTRVEGAQASYAPTLVTWNARTDANQRAAELNFDRGWQRETYGRDDFYRRNRATEDDFRYRDNQAESRRRFLAELGAA